MKPNNPEAENDLAVAFDMQGKHDDAITHYMQALRLNPDYPNAHYNLADTLRTLGKTDDAIVHYLRALRLRPRYPEAYNSLGLALAGQRKFEEAIAHYMEALRLNLVEQGRGAEAIAQFEAALQLKPDDAEARQQLDRLR